MHAHCGHNKAVSVHICIRTHAHTHTTHIVNARMQDAISKGALGSTILAYTHTQSLAHTDTHRQRARWDGMRDAIHEGAQTRAVHTHTDCKKIYAHTVPHMSDKAQCAAQQSGTHSTLKHSHSVHTLTVVPNLHAHNPPQLVLLLVE